MIPVLGKHLLDILFAKDIVFQQRLQYRLAKRVERVVGFILLPGPPIVFVKTRIEHLIGERVHQISEVDGRNIKAAKFGIPDKFHMRGRRKVLAIDKSNGLSLNRSIVFSLSKNLAHISPRIEINKRKGFSL